MTKSIPGPAAARFVCSRCHAEARWDTSGVVQLNDGDEQLVCTFCGSDLFDLICSAHVITARESEGRSDSAAQGERISGARARDR